MQSNKTVVSLIVLASLGILGALIFWGTKSSLPPTDPTEVEKGEFVRDNSNVKGNEDAKVTLVEFGDYQCPACGGAAPVINKILEEYPDDVRFVYRHFPLPIHNNAELAARVAESAGNQNKYWEMHDKLFENQGAWSNSLSPEKTFEEYAGELELDIDKFKSDIRSADITNKISLDKGDAKALKVDSTPTIYINGEKVESGSSFTSLKGAIDKVLEN